MRAKLRELPCHCEYSETRWVKMCDQHRAEFDKVHREALDLYRAGHARREQHAEVRGLI